MRGNQAAQSGAEQGLAQSSGVFGTLSPFLTNEMIHPSGFAPTDLAAMNTGAQQGAGGAVAGAVGQGGLRAARTRNIGGDAAATAAATRSAGETLSKERLGIESANAKLKSQQQQAGASGLENLFHTSSGVVAPDVNANTQAENATWDWAKDLFVPLATAAAGMKKPM